MRQQAPNMGRCPTCQGTQGAGVTIDNPPKSDTLRVEV